MSIVQTSDLTYFYQDGEVRRNILKDVSVSFERGTFYTILGASGSGKTTFLSLLGALDVPNEGVVAYEGKDISRIGFDKYRRDNISIIFQHYNLVPYLTAVENVMTAMDATDNEVPKDQKNVAFNLLDYIGIDEAKAKRRVNKLSGGEQQRVAIARALATNVDVILADEPTGNLDREMESDIVDIFKRLAHDHNKCVIVVTHSIEIAALSDQTYVLKRGKLLTAEESAREELQAQEALLERNREIVEENLEQKP